MAAYCDASDVARLIPSVYLTDANWAIGIASAIVDSYTGTSFAMAAPGTQTFNGVRSGIIPLNGPFSSITSVTVDGSALSSTSYTVESWGIVLGKGYGYNSPYSYGSTVVVSATFGYTSVPSDVRYATALLAEALLQHAANRPVETTDTEGNAVLPEVAIESYGISVVPSTDNPGTSGTALAYQLLDAYRIPAIA